MVRFVIPMIVVTALTIFSLLLHVRSEDVLAGSSRRNVVTVPSKSPIYCPGRVEGATPEIELRPQAKGAVVELTVEEGQQVRAGDVLLRLEAEALASGLLLAETQLDLAQARKRLLVNGARPEERREAEAMYLWKTSDLELAKASRQRARELLSRSAVSDQHMDDREAAVKSLSAQVVAAKMRADLLQAPPREEDLAIADAEIAAAQANVRKSRALLNQTVVYAPAVGQILKVNIDPGELAGPDSVRPAVLMADTRRRFVRAFVEELDAPRVRPGMKANVSADGLPGKSFSGLVVEVSPRMSAKELWTDDPAERYDTKTREVLIVLEDSQELIVGLRVDVVIDSTEHAERQEGSSMRSIDENQLP